VVVDNAIDMVFVRSIMAIWGGVRMNCEQMRLSTKEVLANGAFFVL